MTDPKATNGSIFPEPPAETPAPAPAPATEPAQDAPLTADEERLVDDIDRAVEGEESSPFLKVIQTLKQAPVVAAPPDFLQQVQTKIREQSGGRYYGYQWKSRLPSGLLMLLMLVVVILIAYVLARPTPVPRPTPPTAGPIAPAAFDGPTNNLGLAAIILSTYGDVQNEGLTADGHRRLVVELPKTRIPALEAEISLYPDLQIEGEPEQTLDPSFVLMRVLVPPAK